MSLPHLPTKEYLQSILKDGDTKLRILCSACLHGRACGWDATNNGEYPVAHKLITHPRVEVVPFCPEDFAYGTPRDMSDIHGGNGYDVLDGKAKVLSEKGEDWTEGMVNAAHKMRALAQKENVHLALLLDMSAACGSQVISVGSRFSENRLYQKGPGLCAALLMRNGIKVVSQRDYRTLDVMLSLLDEDHQSDPSLVDHHETAWYKEYFTI